MTRRPEATRLERRVTAMAALETRIEALLDRLRAEAGGHPGAAAALQRFHAVAAAHRAALAAHFRDLEGHRPQGGQDSPGGAGDPGDGRLRGAAEGPPPAGSGAGGGPAGVAGGPGEETDTGVVSRALRQAYLALNDATFGYGVLHETAHVSDSVRFAATLQLAERHLRDYAGAAQAINQLLADVAAWELRQEGQCCECQCPACQLGICWCVAHTTDAINAAWRETAPAHPSGGLRVVPNPRRPAGLDVREGDLVIAVDGQRVATTSDVTTAVMRRAPGEAITLGIERRPGGALEITATRP